MSSCGCIKAYHRQEERYAGLNLKFTKAEDRERILKLINELKQELDVSPDIFDNQEPNGSGGVYIEFLDDYDKDSSEFFERLIKGLDIKECEA